MSAKPVSAGKRRSVNLSLDEAVVAGARATAGKIPPVLMALVVDCQADLLSDLSTRLVVPLQAINDGRQVSARLNPILMVGSERLVCKAHVASKVKARLLRHAVASLVEHEYGIKAHALGPRSREAGRAAHGL